MKNIWSNRFTTILVTFLVTWTLISLSPVYAQSQTTVPPCCVDRWDPGWTDRGMWGPGMMGPRMSQRMMRHRTYMQFGVPSEYRGQRNPLPMTQDTVREGGAIYAKQCAECHGAQGLGDGEAGKSLNPSPALLAYMIQMPMSVDEYLLWSISEGGVQFGTDMPAFKETLTTQEIWKIMVFMRAGFPVDN